MPIIIIEGLIGAGKTVLVEQLTEDLEIIPIPEEYENNPYLKDCYTNKPPYNHGSKDSVFKAQIWFLANRSELYKHSLAHSANYVADRSIWGDKAFAKALTSIGMISRNDYATYMSLWRVLNTEHFSPLGVIFLSAQVDKIMERIEKRGREIEKHITKEYITILKEYYDEIIEELEEITTTRIIPIETIEGENGKVKTCSYEYISLCNWIKKLFKIEKKFCEY